MFTLDGVCLLALASKVVFKGDLGVRSELAISVRHRHTLYYLLHVFSPLRNLSSCLPPPLCVLPLASPHAGARN